MTRQLLLLPKRLPLASAIAAAGLPGGISLGASFPDPFTLLGRQFRILPDDNRQAYNVTATRPAGQTGGWFRLEARQGDNNTGETQVERVGLDAFNDVLLDVTRIEFSVIPGENLKAEQNGDFWNLFELHAKKHPDHPGEYQTSGPLRFSEEWSSGSSNSVFRIWRQWYVVDPPANAGHVGAEFLYNGPGLQIGRRYDFVVEVQKDDTDGAVRVWMDGVQIVAYAGQFGYGPLRDLWPQFRIYRNTRPKTGVAFYKIDRITTTPGTPVPSEGNVFLLDEDGAYLLDEDGAYLVEAA